MSSFLPIGSVCTIKETNREVMIVGYNFMINKKKYDYMVVLYPAGLLNNTDFFGMNEEQIKELLFRGYDTELYKKFIKNLKINLTEAGNKYDNMTPEEIDKIIKEEINKKIKGEK